MADDSKCYTIDSGGAMWRLLSLPTFNERTPRKQLYFSLGLIVLCWFPIAILCFFNLDLEQYHLLFVRDVATHVRFLFVLPILIFARSSINKSFHYTVEFFYQTKIVDDENKEPFERILTSLKKWSNSKIVDYVLLFFVYALFFIQEENRRSDADFYAPWHIADNHITIAGWWYSLISLPILQLLLYRWFYTISLWIIFLRKISKLNFHLSALHPDSFGGLGFLRYTQLSFFPIALAFSALAAGFVNNMILFSGISISEYKIMLGSIVVMIFIVFVLPLTLLVPLLTRIRRTDYLKYSLESWPIARKFGEELLAYYQTGTEKPDVSWHADMIGSFEKTENMKVNMVDKNILITFAFAVIIPFLPVLAQQVPLEEFLLNFLKKILL